MTNPYKNISPAAFTRVVRVVFGYGRAVTREEIIEATDVDAASIDHVLDRLIKRGLIDRTEPLEAP